MKNLVKEIKNNWATKNLKAGSDKELILLAIGDLNEKGHELALLDKLFNWYWKNK
jgi:hypothetical protein